MCGIFGFRAGKEVKFGEELVKELAIASADRGTDATGYSYNVADGMEVHKRPLDAYSMKYRVPSNVKAVLGHTRLTTQGNCEFNDNNHPFVGRLLDGSEFSFAHNGTLWNDSDVSYEYKLPKTDIATDSYVGCQLLEYLGKWNLDNFIEMGEAFTGQFIFTILNSDNELTFIRKENPITLLYFKKYDMYVYASTTEILFKALSNIPELVAEIGKTVGDKTKAVEKVEVPEHSILSIDIKGNRNVVHFDPIDDMMLGNYGVCGDYWYSGDWEREETVIQNLSEYLGDIADTDIFYEMIDTLGLEFVEEYSTSSSSALILYEDYLSFIGEEDYSYNLKPVSENSTELVKTVTDREEFDKQREEENKVIQSNKSNKSNSKKKSKKKSKSLK